MHQRWYPELKLSKPIFFLHKCGRVYVEVDKNDDGKNFFEIRVGKCRHRQKYHTSYFELVDKTLKVCNREGFVCHYCKRLTYLKRIQKRLDSKYIFVFYCYKCKVQREYIADYNTYMRYVRIKKVCSYIVRTQRKSVRKRSNINENCDSHQSK